MYCLYIIYYVLCIIMFIDVHIQFPFLFSVYILLPGFVIIAIVALLYVCCAKRYRFNWFERSLMEQTSCANTISVTAQDADEKACIIPAGSSDSGVINHGSTQDTKLPMEATKFPISMETTMLPAQSGATYGTSYKPLSYQPPDISLTSGCSSDSILSSGAFTGGSVCDNTELFWVPAAVAGAGKKRASTGLIQIGVTTCDSPPGMYSRAPDVELESNNSDVMSHAGNE